MRIKITQNYEQLSIWVARYVQQKILRHEKIPGNKPFVLGLPTGSSIEGTYKELIRLTQQKELSFKNIITFNMDEYYGLAPDHPQSYAYFMNKNFFDHIDIDRNNIHLPDGRVDDPLTHSQQYEESIAQAGGIDLFLGSIGRNAHIAFNEPYSSFQSLTHLQDLEQSTIIANSRFFDNKPEDVPSTAITVGIQTVMSAHEVLLLVSGTEKAAALQKIVEEGVNHRYPASALQLHANAYIVCDEAACEELSVRSYRYFLSQNEPTTTP